jgi:hypothetical protein
MGCHSQEKKEKPVEALIARSSLDTPENGKAHFKNISGQMRWIYVAASDDDIRL